MPRTCWILVLGTFLTWASTAAAGDLNFPACNCTCQAKCRPAPLYSLSPGCCEARRHCFDNAWDGYCQERARWDTFWCKVGTGAFYPCSPCATCDGRGAALEARLRPADAACGCHPGTATKLPTAPR